MKKIGIFCAASENIDQLYFEAARQIGQWMGINGHTLVYGGADMGLMECVAREAKKAGSHLVGVVPKLLEEGGHVSTLPDELIHTQTLSDRKDRLIEISDILLALPGGIGTFDEIFTTMASAVIGYHSKKVILYNVNGFYDKLILALNDLEVKQFTRRPLSNYYMAVDSTEKLNGIL